MHKGTEEILLDGFSVWRRNKKIAVPYLLKMIVQALLLGVCIFSIVFIFFQQVSFDPANISDYQSLLRQAFTPILILSALLIGFGFILVSALVSAYFDAGAIGMARKAVESGETSIDYMTEYGIRRFPSLFLARLLVNIASFIPLLLLGAAVLVIGAVAFAINVYVLVATVLSIVFAAAPYFIVIAGSGAIEGLEKSCLLLKENKKPYMLLWIFGNYVGEYANSLAVLIAGVVFALGLLVIPIELHITSAYSLYDPSLIRYLTSLLFSLLTLGAISVASAILALTLIFVLIVSPLTTVWWTELYMDKTETHRIGQDRIHRHG